MLGIKVKKEETEKVLKALKEKGLLSEEAKVEKKGEYSIIPLKRLSSQTLNSLKKEYEIIEHQFQLKKEKKSFRELAKSIVPPELHAKLKTAFDTVGDIGILEIDEELRPYEKELGKALLESNSQLRTAVRKEGAHSTPFRIQLHKHLAGEEKTTTLHKENKAIIEVDINKMYFSPRLSNERKRIADQVREGEDVLVMFSGAAPYICVIGKNAKPNSITGIELNPVAHEYAKRNIKRNKLNKVILINDDVKRAVEKINKKFDRIIMPLPKGGEEFLPYALKVAKPKSIIHLYQFASSENIPHLKEEIQKRIRKLGWNVLRIKEVVCGQQSPYTYRVCFDIYVSRG